MITGPGSPSVLSNMVVSIEQHVDWIVDCVTFLDRHGFSEIEPTSRAQAGWDQHVADCGAITLLPQADSWYMGANVPGKPRMLLPYIAGVDRYRAVCDEVVESDYLGFRLTGDGVEHCNDGVVRRLQLDVTIMLETMASMGLPPLESLTPSDARALWDASASIMPPGPDVGEVVNGVFASPAGDLAYQLLRPATAGPHPVVLYFHGGGWVLGSATSDAPLCRDLCVRADAIVVSVDYRHAPEHPFPAAVDDACAAVRWAASNIAKFGGIEGQLVVAGWSAGANLAAVVCQDARDVGDVAIAGQLLLCPVVDFDFDPSLVRRERRGLPAHAISDAVVLGSLRRPRVTGRSARGAIAGTSRRAPARVDRHGGVRSPARRRRGLRARAGGGGRVGAPRRGPGPDAHVNDHGRRHHFGRRRARRRRLLASRAPRPRCVRSLRDRHPATVLTSMRP